LSRIDKIIYLFIVENMGFSPSAAADFVGDDRLQSLARYLSAGFPASINFVCVFAVSARQKRVKQMTLK